MAQAAPRARPGIVPLLTIAMVDQAPFDQFVEWAPFDLAEGELPRMYQDAAEAGRVYESVACSWIPPLPLPNGEPSGLLLEWGIPRFGVLFLLATRTPDDIGFVSGWPFVTEGVEHRLTLDGMILSESRLSAFIEGSVEGGPGLTWFDPFFAVDRGYYAVDGAPQIVLAGYAVAFGPAAPAPPVRVAPDAPNYGFFRDVAPDAVKPDGSIEFRTDRMQSIVPVDEPLVPHAYRVRGPVKRVDPFHAPLVGRPTIMVRVTVAQVGPDNDQDFDLDLVLTDAVLEDAAPPAPGDMVEATLLLHGRLWLPNLPAAPP